MASIKVSSTGLLTVLGRHDLTAYLSGTWIPLQRGLELAKQYNCEMLLKPIIDFQPAAKSPPLAPKHLVAIPTVKAPRKVGVNGSLHSNLGTRSSRRQALPSHVDSDPETLSNHPSEDGSMTPSPSEASSSSRTPSPIHDTPSERRAHAASMAGPSRRDRYRRSVDNAYDDASDEDININGVHDARAYGDQILEYFISDTNQIPQVLISPPLDFNPNMAIDDDGHTALHWACAMGRIRVVKFLLTAGADIFNVNKAGQTALMRSVMFANNYDVRKFPELYELLHRSTLNIDNYNRTVFHHVVDVAMSKGKTHAARYYMETVLARLADYPKELADVINFQDEDGETALTMAARCRSKRLVKILIDHGADPKIVNNDGKSTEDYILEDERFRSSPTPSSRPVLIPPRQLQSTVPTPFSQTGYPAPVSSMDRPPLHHSATAQKATTRCVNDMAIMLDSLAASFDQELREKEKDMTQAQALLGNIQGEILESQRVVGQLRNQAESMGNVHEQLQHLEGHLLTKMGNGYRLGFEKWLTDEEKREGKIRQAAGGDLKLTESTATFTVDEPRIQSQDGAGTSMDSKGKRKLSDMTEDISDIFGLYSNLPTDAEGIMRECNQIRDEVVAHHYKRRKQAFEEIVQVQKEAGTSGRMNEYRRLIAAGCGGIPPAEVDGMLSVLLEVSVFLFFFLLDNGSNLLRFVLRR